MAVHMRNGIQYGGIPNGTVKGVNPSTVPTTVKQLNQIGTVGNIAPVTIPSAVKFSNGDTLETAIGSVATIETSPAVAAHDAGEYIFYNGQMYKVIAAIAVGETLTVDTNIEATSVGTELTQLNNGLTQFITYRIVQKNVTISANGTIYDQSLDVPTISGYKAFAIGGWYSLGGGYADSPFTRLSLNETTQQIEYAMMTRSTSQVTLTIRIKVLYIRSDWVNIPV